MRLFWENRELQVNRRDFNNLTCYPCVLRDLFCHSDLDNKQEAYYRKRLLNHRPGGVKFCYINTLGWKIKEG